MANLLHRDCVALITFDMSKQTHNCNLFQMLLNSNWCMEVHHLFFQVPPTSNQWKKWENKNVFCWSRTSLLWLRKKKCERAFNTILTCQCTLKAFLVTAMKPHISCSWPLDYNFAQKEDCGVCPLALILKLQ